MAAIVAFATTVAACGGDTTNSQAAVTPESSPFTANASGPPTAPVAEELTFTGALRGQMTSGTAGDAFACAATGGAFVAGPILGTVAGTQIEMNIALLSFHGAGTYAPDGVSFDAAYDHYYPANGSSSWLAIASDLTSGTVDIALAANTDPNHVVAHVTGAWRCPKG